MNHKIPRTCFYYETQNFKWKNSKINWFIFKFYCWTLYFVLWKFFSTGVILFYVNIYLINNETYTFHVFFSNSSYTLTRIKNKKNIYTSLCEIDKCYKISTNKLDCQIIISLIFFHNVKKIYVKNEKFASLPHSHKKTSFISHIERCVSYSPRCNIFGYFFLLYVYDFYDKIKAELGFKI